MTRKIGAVVLRLAIFLFSFSSGLSSVVRSMNRDNKVSWLDCDDDRLVYHYVEGSEPAVMYCSGFQSSMGGTKALALEDYCRKNGLAFCRFDYRGHGDSNGNFVDYTLSNWIEDASKMLHHVLFPSEVILVGSSMGAWIALQLALLYPDRIFAVLCIAAAPDFLQDLYSSSPPEQHAEWQTNGVVYLPTQYDSNPYPITWKLIEDAQEKWLLLADNNSPIPIRCPVRLLHGQSDEDVSWKKSLDLAELLETDDVTLTLIKSGDHRLSRPADLDQILKALEELKSLHRHAPKAVLD